MDIEVEAVTIDRLVPVKCPINIVWDKKVKLNSFIAKGSNMGYFTLDNTDQKYPIKNNRSGKVMVISEKFLEFDEEKTFGAITLAKIELCKHEVIYNGTCSECFETNLEKNFKSQKLFDGISNLHVSGTMMQQKIESFIEKKKLI